ncbi:hypothetical protein BKN38_05075 [Helicobacter sp. CLO-3]|uniref:FkbM family methyltransferase n=1 Tax=unclassified Helicobacter TaxID=2593540 RepID=UPI000805D271|nr:MULTISPECIES: FkbM family methyltransferase [unclassified Helicobacter]OBV29893.1 hypothetical protein BA723_03840 [Helicobacter sp. CLO-3]OHU83697.1 hypothetical protein BKN38_05075 [Helicobacter sp. CLO-3]
MFVLARKTRNFFRSFKDRLGGVDHRLDLIPHITSAICEIHKSQVLQEQRYSDPKRLEKFGYKVYSQNEEDGMIAEIFNRIGCTNKFFIEFGVQDGLECNAHFLLFQGWSGVFIEGSSEYCEKIKENFKIPIERSQLTLLNSFITAENINDLIGQTKAKEICDIDLLSIDIDGNDYHVFEAIDVIKPRVVVIEFNAKFPPPAEYIMPYNPSHVWDGTDMHGASLESLKKLGIKKGYRLVATDLCGVNVFFVRDDLYGNKFPDDCSAKNLYNSNRLLRRLKVWHVSKYFLPNAAQ